MNPTTAQQLKILPSLPCLRNPEYKPHFLGRQNSFIRSCNEADTSIGASMYTQVLNRQGAYKAWGPLRSRSRQGHAWDANSQSLGMRCPWFLTVCGAWGLDSASRLALLSTPIEVETKLIISKNKPSCISVRRRRLPECDSTYGHRRAKGWNALAARVKEW